MFPSGSYTDLLARQGSEGLRKFSDAKTDEGADAVAEDVAWLREFADHLGRLLDAAKAIAKP